MEFLGDILGVFGSAVSGGLVGLIGTAFKGWQEHKRRQQEIELIKVNREYDLREMEKEADLHLRQTEAEFAGKQGLAHIEADAARDVAAAKLQQTSYESDKATYSQGVAAKVKGFAGNLVRAALVMVDVVRGMMRPSITVYLLGINSVMAWEVHLLAQGLVASGTVTAAQAWPLYMEVVRAIVFLTTTAVTWWFGSRPNSSSSARGPWAK